MNSTLTLVIWMAGFTWLLWLLASLIRVKGWTVQGIILAMGNRDNLPEASPFAGRAERTARNTADALILFTAISLVAHVSAVHHPLIEEGARIFVVARLFYAAVYYAGIPYLRTLVWGVSMVGLGMMVSALV